MTRKRTTKNGQFQPKGCWIRPEKRLAIYLRDEFRCVYCLRDMHGVQPQNITLDHLNPRSNGGHNHERNLVTCCRWCNSEKQAKRWLAYVRRHWHFCEEDIVERVRFHRRRELKPYLELARSILAEPKGDDHG